MVQKSLSFSLLRLIPEGAWEVVKYDYWSDMVPVYGCKKFQPPQVFVKNLFVNKDVAAAIRADLCCNTAAYIAGSCFSGSRSAFSCQCRIHLGIPPMKGSGDGAVVLFW